MRPIFFGTGVIVGIIWASIVPAKAAPQSILGIGDSKVQVAPVQRIGWRRYYRRYGYPAPYAYYPPAYGHYPPPYGYYPPPRYPYYAPYGYRYYPPYYAPY